MRGHTNFTRRGITINEGEGPINFTLHWRPYFFVYVYAFGRRWSYYKDYRKQVTPT